MKYAAAYGVCVQAILSWLILLGLTGCASPRAYFIDRGRDAADIFTVMLGCGAGAKARVGPLETGLFINKDITGLRGGLLGTFPREMLDAPFMDVSVLLYHAEIYSEGDLEADRHKTYGSWGLGPYTVAFEDFFLGNDIPLLPYYTDIQVAVGAGATLRLGFNVGELTDFVLGWAMFDIYCDDLESQKTESGQSHVTGNEKSQ